MRTILAVAAAVCVMFSTTSGQRNYEGRNFSKGRIILSATQSMNVFNIFISKDSIEYYEKDLVDRHTMGLDQIEKVQEPNGHWGVLGSVLGSIAGIAPGVALANALTVTTRSDGYYITEVRTETPLWPVYVCVMAGAGIGYLIGSNIQDWKTVYSKDMASLGSLNISTGRTMQGIFVSYSLSF